MLFSRWCFLCGLVCKPFATNVAPVRNGAFSLIQGSLGERQRCNDTQLCRPMAHDGGGKALNEKDGTGLTNGGFATIRLHEFARFLSIILLYCVYENGIRGALLWIMRFMPFCAPIRFLAIASRRFPLSGKSYCRAMSALFPLLQVLLHFLL